MTDMIKTSLFWQGRSGNSVLGESTSPRCVSRNTRRTIAVARRIYRATSDSAMAEPGEARLPATSPYCPTDISIKRWPSTTGPMEYRITVWRDLGSCTVPTNAKRSSQKHRPEQKAPTGYSMSMKGLNHFPYLPNKVRNAYEEPFSLMDLGVAHLISILPLQ